MTASQQPDAEHAPLTSPAAAGSGSTGHDKAVEIVREIGRFHRPTSVSVVRQSVTCQCGAESTDTDGLERHRAELSLAALRAALAAGDTNVAEALGGRIEEHRRCAGCGSTATGGRFMSHSMHLIHESIDEVRERRFVTDWTEAP